MAAAPRRITIGDLVGSTVVTAEGKRVGRVVDVQATRGPEYRVVALDYGLYAWLYRVHVLRALTRRLSGREEPHTVPWEAVDRIEGTKVWLKRDAGSGRHD